MPESYTHLRIARRALQLAGLEAADPAAFLWGSNGPDTLFCYRVWRSKKNRGEDLPTLGSRLHRENTGLFLRSLIRNANTPSQKSYVLGYLTHYAADCTLHPYIFALTKEGEPFAKPGGHGYLEIGIDSLLHEQDTGDAAVPFAENTPLFTGEALAGASALLQSAAADSLGVTVSREALADSFWHTRLLRHLFVSRHGGLYGLCWLTEPLFGGRGFVTGHITPAALEHPLPDDWTHPVTGQKNTGGLQALLQKAEERASTYLLAADACWKGQLGLDRVCELLGSRCYDTGLADSRSDPALDNSKSTQDNGTCV